MLLPPSSQSELPELVAYRQAAREAEAAAERLRIRQGPRRRTASFLHHLADRLAPPEPAGGRDAELSVRTAPH